MVERVRLSMKIRVALRRAARHLRRRWRAGLARRIPAAPPPPTVVVPPPGVDVFWREATRLIDQQLQTADALDAKITPLIGLVAAVAAIVATQGKQLGDATGPLLLELISAFALLLLAFRLREFNTVPRLDRFALFVNATGQQMEEAFIQPALEAYRDNERALAAKTLLLNLSLVALSVFLLTVFVTVLTTKGGT
jgi:hypothetical protein